MILLADGLAPSETVQLDKSKVLSFVTRGGSTNSHTAILARTMNIPALIGVDFPEKLSQKEDGDSQTVDGVLGIVDGYQGTFYINPDEETLAIDRQNPKLDGIYDAHHEAVLRMLKMVVDNGHKEGCWVGICGELGADTELTETFLRMGFDELSVSPSMVLKVREKIRSVDLGKVYNASSDTQIFV